MQEYFGPNQVNKGNSLKSYIAVLLVIVAFFSGWYFGNGRSFRSAGSGDQATVKNTNSISSEFTADTDFQIFWDVWQDIKENYVHQPVDEINLFYGALQGLMYSLDDPYSDYFNPKTAAEFDEELSGSFSGIGVEIGRRNGNIVVIMPLKDSPGEKAGLKAGDIIMAINDEDIYGLGLDAVVSKIRGEEGSSVVLTIVSREDGQTKDITVNRQTIDNIGLRWEYLEDGLVHIKLSSFDEDSENLINKLIRELEARSDIKGIVLDMRNNPGGFLEMSIEIASEWVEEGVIVSERDNQGSSREHHARGRARLTSIPTVIIVNEGSASATEIVAGALQDYSLAQIVGKNTFGKGSVQKYEVLPDGSAYRLTVAQWYTPLGRAIDGVGVAPDFEVDLTDEDFNNDNDPQLDKAIELLNSQN